MDSSLFRILYHCPNVTHLTCQNFDQQNNENIAGNYLQMTAALKQLNLSQLTYLDVSFSTIDPKFLATLVNQAPHLKTLILNNVTTQMERFLIETEHLSTLEVLHLNNTDLINTTLKILLSKDLGNLKELSLNQNNKLNFQDITTIFYAKLPHLETLSCTHANLLKNRFMIDKPSTLANLKYLYLSNNLLDNNSAIYLLGCLNNLSKLKLIDLSKNKLIIETLVIPRHTEKDLKIDLSSQY